MKKTMLTFCILLSLSCGVFSAQAGDTAELGMHHTVSTLHYIDSSGTVKTWSGKTVPLPGRAADISAAITSDGTVYVWGSLYRGDDAQYQPIMERSLTPQRIAGIQNAAAISVGGTGFAVLCSDGSVYTWGLDEGGSNGYGERRSSAVPLKVALPPVRAVSRGWTTSAAVAANGNLYTWGSNENSILGRGPLFPYTRVECTPGLVNVEPMHSVCVGRSFYIAALSQSGAAYQWGSTAQDDKTPPPVTDSGTPKLLDSDVSFVQVSLGEGQSAGVTADGSLYTWGYNLDGELGIADSLYVDYPTLTRTDAMIPGALPHGSLDNLLNKQRSYTQDTFTDINEDAWYGLNQTGAIAQAYEYALIDGTGKQQFSPNTPLRISEAIRLVCSLQDRYAGGTGVFTGKGLWYQPYVHHAVTVGIFHPGDFSDYNANATRAQMAYLFAHALPEAELEPIHTNISIPDVSDRTPYAEEIRTLYHAGILAGVDEAGSFAPERTITRAEATAIFLRLVKPEFRIP